MFLTWAIRTETERIQTPSLQL
uniref:Uncharacterized protein n=1 Tax=Rhizophora mucronata TaxID=61149 RepID=A0A2P2NMM1_RHIMU